MVMPTKKEKESFAYSKKLLYYARVECWTITIAVFALAILNKDVADLTTICLAGWAAYGVARAFYYNMAKADHQIQLLQQIDPKANEKIKEIIIDKVEEGLKETINEDIDSK